MVVRAYLGEWLLDDQFMTTGLFDLLRNNYQRRVHMLDQSYGRPSILVTYISKLTSNTRRH